MSQVDNNLSVNKQQQQQSDLELWSVFIELDISPTSLGRRIGRMRSYEGTYLALE
jgi:hypothetical protein